MKAQTFLEWFAGYIENHALTNDGDLTNTALTFHKLKDFYSQPFKPELITELFEGVKEIYLDCSTQKSFYCPDHTIIIWFHKNSGYNGINYYDDGAEEYEDYSPAHLHFLPKTLNDFIVQCNCADIELNWKPEIIKEYFT